MSVLDCSSILITGGTGSLGTALLENILRTTEIDRIVIYSRDELKQFNLRNKFGDNSRIRWFIGDVRDSDRLSRALKNIDYVIHAAALKQVDAGEYNPIEFVKTNIYGSQNLIEACIDAGVKKCVAISTDKASSPLNLYGATKLTADKLFTSANNYSTKSGTRFSVVRYGNVIGSRGSVIPKWQNLANSGLPIPITDLRMTRFWITLEDALTFIKNSFQMMSGGELYVPRIPSMKMIDLAKTIAPDSKIIEVGIRAGEKIHEEMISLEDSRRTIFASERFIINPIDPKWEYNFPIGEKLPDGFAYQSNTNDLWLSPEKLREYLREEEK